MSRNKFLKLLFSALLVITMAFTATTSAYAATGTKKVTSSGTMSLALNKGQTAIPVKLHSVFPVFRPMLLLLSLR